MHKSPVRVRLSMAGKPRHGGGREKEAHSPGGGCQTDLVFVSAILWLYILEEGIGRLLAILDVSTYFTICIYLRTAALVPVLFVYYVLCFDILPQCFRKNHPFMRSLHPLPT